MPLLVCRHCSSRRRSAIHLRVISNDGTVRRPFSYPGQELGNCASRPHPIRLQRIARYLGPSQDRRDACAYRRPLRLASGKFAIIEKSKEFTLVPWRAALERQRGKVVGGIVRGSSVSFDLTKKRGIGIG